LYKTDNQLKDVIRQLDDTRDQLELMTYFHNCSLNRKWKSCKIFTDINKNSKIIAITRNEDEKYGTWEKSMEVCEKYNASLVTIESIEKQFFLQTFLQMEDT